MLHVPPAEFELASFGISVTNILAGIWVKLERSLNWLYSPIEIFYLDDLGGIIVARLCKDLWILKPWLWHGINSVRL